jgi:enediyne biosynthesis protein E4
MKNITHRTTAFFLFVVGCAFQSCTPKDETQLLELLPTQYTGVDFTNQLYEDENLNIITFEYFYNGAGVGIGDVNNDGLQDIFFSGNMVSNRLYLNKGDMRFENITKSSGLATLGKWATGVAMVDINQDGWLDLYVCYAGPFADPQQRTNELYINNGNNTFTEKAKEYGLDDTGHSVQAAFFDYDRDGDLDVYILTNTTDETGPNIIRPKRLKGEMINADRLYRNNGNLTYSNVSKDAGITIEGYGLGVSICDINMDGWSDIFVSNDYLSNDLLYVNNRDGTFTNRANLYFKHTSYSAMGNDVADFNNDGLTDVVEVDMLPPDNKRQKLMLGSTNYDRYRSELQYGYTPQFMRNTLQLNRGLDEHGNPCFSEIGQLSGIHATDWSWSALFADMDNDGWKDLLITNGYPRDITNRDFASYKVQEFMHEGYSVSVKKKLLKAIGSLEGAYLPNYIFKNNGDLTFSNQSSVWGFRQPSYSTGAAYADLDNDGDLDYVTNNTNEPASIFRNHAKEKFGHHFLRISLEGMPSNRMGYGARMFFFCGRDTMQYLEQSPYRGFQSSVDQHLHVGLGKSAKVDSLLIIWPDERFQKLVNVAADRLLTVKWSDAKQDTTKTIYGRQNHKNAKFFTSSSKYRGIEYRHQEAEYADFKIEPLLPHKYSSNGPGVAVGDINGDGADDLFVGGAFNQSGQFFIQQEGGGFSNKILTTQKKYEEDMGVLLFDADQDHDNDLYIVSGGNEFEASSAYFQHRLFINDGKGQFSATANALPQMNSSGSCVVAADIDQDNDLDLFIGGRLTPHAYPTAGKSYILQNNKGVFSDVTDQIAPGLKDIGMVTAALWTDVNNDNQVDLMVVGEWMPITIFLNVKGKLSHKKNAVSNSSGWWNSVTGADFDADGDTDYILGNLGLNSKYRTSLKEPVNLNVADINKDGVADPILGYYIQGVNRPAHPRDDILIHMSTLKKKYPSYASYADVTIPQFVGDSKASVLKSDILASAYLENKGGGQWELRALPIEVQFAPAFGMTIGEFTGDDFDDVVLVGNSHSPDVLTGRYDASEGLLLKGDGDGNFKSVSIQESGILVSGDAKGLALLRTFNNRTLLLATQNNDSLYILERRNDQRRFLTIEPSDFYAIITDKAGRKSKHEFYYGNGYLSQSSRSLRLPTNVTSVVIVDYLGKQRNVSLD